MSSDYYYKAQEVKAAAYKNWFGILSALSGELDAAIKKAPRHVSCPVHGGKDGFRFFKDGNDVGGGHCNSCGAFPDGFDVLMWVNNWDFTKTLNEIGDYVQAQKHYRRGASQIKDKVTQKNVSSHQNKKTNVINMTQDQKPWLAQAIVKADERMAAHRAYQSVLVKKIDSLWNESLLLDAPESKPLWRYLANRGISVRNMNTDSIKFHPKLSYWEDEELVGYFPAIVGAIRSSDGEIVTLHRIYITSQGLKSPVSEPKKMLPVPDGKSVMGASIPLVEHKEGVLGVAEGLETALAAYKATGIPVSSTINATLMEGFIPPQGVHTVYIWADKDKSKRGEEAADVLAEKLRANGIKVMIFYPAMPIPSRAKGVDWNDVLLNQGVLGFPRVQMMNVMQDVRRSANASR